MTRAACAGAVLAILLAAAPAAAAAGPAGLRPARALLVYDRDTHTVVYARNGDAELPIASLTKLMTAYVALERSRAGARFLERRYQAAPDESLAHVPAGSRLGIADMLRAMLLPSGNDAAYSLAVDVGRNVPRFVRLMHIASHALGLRRTYFTTPIGLPKPAGNRSSARDLARLADVLLRRPLVASIVRERAARLADGVIVRTSNDLLRRHPWVVGMKTGHTDAAGYCMVGAARIRGVNVISVVLGARSVRARDQDTLALLRFGLDRFRRVAVARANRVYAALPVRGRRRRARVVSARSLALVVARGVRLRLATTLPPRLVGPLPAGARVGAVQVFEDGRPRAAVALVTATRVLRPPPHPPPPPSHLLAWLVLAGGLTVIASGCSLHVMRRREARSVFG